MTLIGRIVLVLVAFIIAAICAFSALIFLTGSMLNEAVFDGPPEYADPYFIADYLAVLLLLGSGVMIASAVTIFAVIVGEIAHIQSWVYYVAISGLAFAATPIIAAYPGDIGFPNSDLLTMCASAGFVGGFVYWLLAGRSA